MIQEAWMALKEEVLVVQVAWTIFLACLWEEAVAAALLKRERLESSHKQNRSISAWQMSITEKLLKSKLIVKESVALAMDLEELMLLPCKLVPPVKEEE
jgi:ribosomal protein L39E